jgi:hypothetical protein
LKAVSLDRLSVDRQCLCANAGRGKWRRTGQNSHGKNPKTLTERVAEWNADHRLGQTDTHETFEGTSKGCKVCKGGV